MLGPFYARASGAEIGEKISPEQWQRLVSDPSYSSVAVDDFPEQSVIVRTRWLGHDPEDHETPRIFVTKAVGDPDVPEVSTETEAESVAVHDSMVARYRERSKLIAGGGAPLLNDGML